MKGEIKHLIIGIITANASQNEQRQILNGITNQAEKLGITTVIFSNIYNSSEYYANVEIENKIYDLIVSQKLDGIILTAESILNTELQQYIYQKIISRSDIPVVVTGAEIPGFICINNDVEADIENIVNHLIEVHNFSDIDLLTGNSESGTSHERLNGYKKSLLAHNIQYTRNKVIFGDFWMSSGEKLALEYINKTRKFPQDIVCANDYMAYGLCDTFISNDISIPDTVTIIGYEYVGERFYHAPILTTYQRNRKAIGQKAVNLVWSMITENQPEDISLSGYFVYGNTCSCTIDNLQLHNELLQIRNEQYYSYLNLTGNFEQQLTLCNSIFDYIDVLQQFAYLIRDITGLHLCLYENWYNSNMLNNTTHLNNENMICYRIITKKNIFDTPIFFNKYELYPEEVILSESGNIMYFCPIFFSGKEFGYFILQYDKPDVYDIIFRDWIKIASNALEILRMKNDINTLLECRNLSFFHDSVTGLYNENGLKFELNEALKKARIDSNVISILIKSEVFFDNTIFDIQNNSIKLSMEIAENLKKISVKKDTFCARIDDKLYAFITIGDYTDEDEALLTDIIKTLIIHSPIYKTNNSINSLFISSCEQNIQDFNFEITLQNLFEELNEKINAISQNTKHSHYSEYLSMRNEVYCNPKKEWDPQKNCYDFGLSYGHFRATYKELFGISFHQDVIQSKISLAKYLLLTTALSLTSISEQCGYYDEKYFLRQFRDLTGLTPTTYRKLK